MISAKLINFNLADNPNVTQIINSKRSYTFIIASALFLGLVIFLSFNRHSKAGTHNYHSEIWADKAGYYVYLPATFKYDFDQSQFPKGIDTLTGRGFILDNVNDRIYVKYTYGVAALQIPFYLAADALAKPLGFEQDGFSLIYHKMINVAAAFYLLIGLIFLIKFLRFEYSLIVSILTAFSIFAMTSLYYYSIDETGMSHLYSFSLSAILLFLFKQSDYLSSAKFFKILFIGLIAGLIIVIRPTDILFLSVLLFLDVSNKTELLNRIKILTKKSPVIILGVLITFIPQLIFWHITFGDALHYSYADEGFDFTDPEMIKFWFAPRNGIITFTPLFLLIIIGLVLMTRRKVQNGIYILSTLIISSFVFSCWWDWGYGCSFGSRNMVDFLPLFAIPLAYLINSALSNKKLTYLLPFVLVLFTALNLKMFYSFDDCFYGEAWEWDIYWRYIFGPTL